MTGYILWNEDKTRHLTKKLRWNKGISRTERLGYVFDFENVERVIVSAKPSYKQLASWDDKNGVIYLGDIEKL